MNPTIGQRRPTSPLLDLFCNRRRGRPKRKPIRARFRPRLEWLESRLAPAATASLNQWANLPSGSWVNGDLNASKASLLEGADVPYQVLFSGLSAGSHTLTIQWQTTKGGLHALDYLTTYTYNTSGPPGTTTISPLGHALDGSGLSSATEYDSSPIPLDPNIHMLPGHSPASNQHFALFAGSDSTTNGITSLSAYTVSGSYTGDSLTSISITFKTSIANPVLVWGGHIASRLDWGPNSGAASVPGSPYHTALASLDGGSIGSQDRALKTAAIVFPADVYVTKVANPTVANATFGFTMPSGAFTQSDGVTPITSFSLTGSNAVPANTPATGTNAILIETTQFNMPSLTTITESLLPAGWTLTSIVINPSADGTSSGSTASLNAPQDSTIFVTFTDTFKGSSSTVTTLHNAADGSAVANGSSLALGSSLYDTATVTVSPSGGPTPTGTVSYFFSSDGGVTYKLFDTEAVGTKSINTAALVPGSYSFEAQYNGDSNYKASPLSAAEPFTVTQGTSSVVTTLHNAADGSAVANGSSLALGSSLYDTAAVSVTPTFAAPTGTVSYFFSSDGGVTYSLFDTEAVGTKSINTAALAPGSYSFEAQYNGDSNYKASPLSAAEPFTVFARAQIAPTNTTAAQFASGTPPLSAVFYTNDGTGHIGQGINPGVFFYYTFVSAPSSGTFSITIGQSNNSTNSEPLFEIAGTNQVNLYDSTGGTSGLNGASVKSLTFQNPAAGDPGNTVIITVQNATANQVFIVGVKYDTKSLPGQNAPVPQPAKITYTFTTVVNGTQQASAGVDLKLSGTQLAPSAGSGVGTTSLTEQQLQPVVDAAIAQWAAAGLDAAQISVLRNTPIHIASFLDAPRLGVESDGEIWLNADAAGWGWFTDANPGATPAAGRIDLLTVVEHEFGHVLFGVQDGQGLMEATLAPGVRLFPGSGPTGDAPAATSTSGLAARPSAAPPSPLADVPAATSGLAVTTSVVTLSDQAITPAHHSPSLVTVASPSTEGADIAATLVTRSEGKASAAALSSADRAQTAVPGPSQGSVLLATLGSGSSTLAPYATRPPSAGPASTAALDLLLSGGSATLPDGEQGTLPGATATLPDGEQGTLPGATRDLPSAEQGVPPFDRVFDGLFGEDAAPLSDGAMTRLLGGEDGLLDGAAGAPDTVFGVAAAVLGAGYYVLQSRLDSREERRAQVAMGRV
jgi:hypothetical protein